MIEVKAKDNDKDFALLLDGQPVERASVFPFNINPVKSFMIIIDGEGLRQLSSHYFSELPIEIRLFNVSPPQVIETVRFAGMRTFNEFPIDDLPLRDVDELIDVDTDLLFNRQQDSFSFNDITQLSFIMSVGLTDWKEAYSYNEYAAEFLQFFNSDELSLSKKDLRNKAEFIIYLKSPQLTIGEEIERCANAIIQADRDAKTSLLSKLREHSLLTYFDFPEEVKVPCEQYLLYFIQFLKDLGVEATSEIQHEVGQVLFAVTPTDKGTALDKIRVALEIFMRLPSSPISDLSSSEEIITQRLEAQIYHLKSQLKLAYAEVLANERSNQALQSMVNSQQRLIDGLVILESAKTVQPRQEKEDKEDLLPGVLAVTKYKGKGFELGLPEIIRRLKDFLHRKD